MKKVLLAAAFASSLVASAALGAMVRDWHDLDKVHNHVLEAIHEMEQARAANHYDMDGHGAKAEQHLREAEGELRMAVESAKRAR